MAKAQTIQSIEIPGIQKESITITIEGVSSLITNRFSDKAKKQILDKQMKKARAARAAKDPQADFVGSIYQTEGNRPGFPASGIKKACVRACGFVDGVQMVKARGAFYVMGDILPIDGDEPQMREDMVRLQGRTADIRYRAEFSNWDITFQVLYSPRIISAESIVNLVETAGFHIGIGDWRPEKDGIHGMFRVKREK